MTATPTIIDTFTGALMEPDDVIEVRVIHVETRESRTLHWLPAADVVWQSGELKARNESGWNIYTGINPRRAVGARGDAGVLLARCIWADHDHATPERTRAIREAAGLPAPTLIINSGHGTHEYWRLTESLESGLWREWQKDLAALLGSDPKVCNPERIMRLPGFKNLKSEPHVLCSIVDCDPSRVYDLGDLHIPMRPKSDISEPVFTVRRRADRSDVGNLVERCQKYLAKLPNAVSGAGGHDATYAAACTCNRFGLSEAEAIELMTWWNATKCDPQWMAHEIAHKVRSAYGKNAGEHGAKLQHDHYARRRRSPVFAMRTRGAA